MTWTRRAIRRSRKVSGEPVFAEIKTITWKAAEDAVQLGKVQLVLGDGSVVIVDPDERAVERVSRDLRADAELAGAGPTVVLICVINHAVEGYGPVLSVLNDAVDEAVDAVFSAGRSRAAVRLYYLARQRPPGAPGRGLCARTTACGGSQLGPRSGRSRPCSPASTE